jgi:hypothetical protein
MINLKTIFLSIMVVFLGIKRSAAQTDMILLDTFSFSGRIIINEIDGTIKLDGDKTRTVPHKWKKFKRYYTDLNMQVLELIDFHSNAKRNFENKPDYTIDKNKMGRLNNLYRINQPDSNYILHQFRKGNVYYLDITGLIGTLAIRKGYGHQVIKKNRSSGEFDTLYAVFDIYNK